MGKFPQKHKVDQKNASPKKHGDNQNAIARAEVGNNIVIVHKVAVVDKRVFADTVAAVG